MSLEASINELNPLIGVDISRLEKEMERYQKLLDEHADHAYRVAEEARKLGFDPKPFVETNIFGTYSLLEAIRKYDKLFIHVSTDEVYGDAENQESFNETSQINPSNPYSATKAAADHLVASYYRTYGIKCITTRCSNNFGPMQFPEKLIPKTIIRTIKNLKVPIYGDGQQIRSWIYVDDHVNAIQSLILKGKPGSVYNITSYEEISNKTQDDDDWDEIDSQ